MKRSDSVSVGVDLGGTKIYVVVLNEKTEVIGSSRNPSNGHEGAERGMETILRTIHEALDDADVGKNAVRSLGIGCPGVVNLEKGVLKVAPNLGWKDVPVRKILEKAMDCPVTVLNDVDAGTYGEYIFGAGRKSSSLLGVFPGTGLGGGFVFRGQILQGRRYSCMEISDLRIGGATLLRPGHEWPTLEDLTSRLAITSAAAVEAYRGHAPSLVDLPLSSIKSKALEKSVNAGDEAIISIIDKSIQLLGVGVAGMVSLLGPDRIVLGGGLVERFQERYVNGLEKQLQALAPPMLIEDLSIVCAELGDDATAKGAGAYAEKA
mgnify:CR=1 FL=1